jgi:hypothetical protein
MGKVNLSWGKQCGYILEDDGSHKVHSSMSQSQANPWNSGDRYQQQQCWLFSTLLLFDQAIPHVLEIHLLTKIWTGQWTMSSKDWMVTICKCIDKAHGWSSVSSIHRILIQISIPISQNKANPPGSRALQIETVNNDILSSIHASWLNSVHALLVVTQRMVCIPVTSLGFQYTYWQWSQANLVSIQCMRSKVCAWDSFGKEQLTVERGEEGASSQR